MGRSGWVEPMLALRAELPPDDGSYGYEFKWDGARIIAELSPGRTEFYSRRGETLSSQFPELAAADFPIEAVIDGEVVCLDDTGVPRFGLLAPRLAGHSPAGAGTGSLCYIIFDLLRLDGRDTTQLCYRERRALLAALPLPNPAWMIPPTLDDRQVALTVAADLGLEGIVAKRWDSTYQCGARTGDWIKFKFERTEDVVIGGFTRGGRCAGRFGALLAGVPADAGLRYVGKIGSGFSDAEVADLLTRLEPLRRSDSPFSNPVPPDADVVFVEPVLAGEVRYSEWTAAGRLRHPVWRGLRLDRPNRILTPAKESGEMAEPGERRIDGHRVRITNPAKQMFPGMSKGEMIEYYLAVAPVLLPHIAHRPASLVRCPDGTDGERFFSKHLPRGAPDWISRLTVHGRKGTVEYVCIGDTATLVWAANLATVEIHVPQWSSISGEMTTNEAVADRIVFDLDPGTGVTILDCAQVATRIRERIPDALVKTSGKKGLHLYAARRSAATEAVALARELARELERETPELVTSRMVRAERTGKVLVDWSQNNAAKTTAAPYTLRVGPVPQVSTPISWPELEAATDERALQFGPAEVLARIDEQGDLFVPLLAG